ncbi:MAG: hypothetical protein U0P81_03320 [Holophagaceae bacterium]
MVWNEDLAKLKRQLKDQGAEPPRPAPAPKPQLPPAPSLRDEDEVFLSAMGRPRSAPGPGAEQVVAEGAEPPALDRPSGPGPEDFQSAMAQLGGVKGLPQPSLAHAPASPAPFAQARPEGPDCGPGGEVPPAPGPSAGMLARPTHLPPDAEPEAETVDIPPPPPQGIRPRPGPLLIQLAAGMAVEVDASLDLRSHSVADAKERIRERIADGLAMGWRTLHVQLGPSEALKQGFLAFLASPSANSVQRYAQAPVPMGGPQAWILYLGVPSG